MSSTSSSSTRPSVPVTRFSSTTALKALALRLIQQLLALARLVPGARLVSRSWKERPMTRLSPRWLIGGGISATSTSTRPACGRSLSPRRTTRRRFGGTPEAMPFSFRNEVASGCVDRRIDSLEGSARSGEGGFRLNDLIGCGAIRV